MTHQSIAPDDLTHEAMRDRVYAALKAWDKVRDVSADLLDDLLIFQDLLDESASGDQPRLTTNRLLSQILDKLEQQNEEYARLLRLRFAEGRTLADTSRRMQWTIDQLRHHQRQAIEQLAAIVVKEERRRRSEHINVIESGLPPSSYTQLFGMTDLQNELVSQVMATDRSWVTAITGIGGIGKTALADAVTRQVARSFRFQSVVWLRVDPINFDDKTNDYMYTIDVLANELARSIAPEVAGNGPMQARLLRVRQELKSHPYLVVIDNLETISNTAFLLRQLQDWAEPSKFLLTTRVRPVGELSVYTSTVDELSVRDAAQLLRHHARWIGQPDLAKATDQEAQLIYDAVGGNPLAIKLVASLAMTMPLPLILEDLTYAYSNEIAGLYTRIYRRAWMALNEFQRQLLLAMPLVAETGATVSQLQSISGLSDAQLYPAINELVNRSLLELRGTTWDRRYGIHRITASFLQADINRWSEEGEHEELAI